MDILPFCLSALLLAIQEAMITVSFMQYNNITQNKISE